MYPSFSFLPLLVVKRDIAERGRDVEGVLAQYNRFVKPSFDTFIYPTMRYADGIFSPFFL
jgi:uridine kinase